MLETMIVNMFLGVLRQVIKNPKKFAHLQDIMWDVQDGIAVAFPRPQLTDGKQ